MKKKGSKIKDIFMVIILSIVLLGALFFWWVGKMQYKKGERIEANCTGEIKGTVVDVSTYIEREKTSSSERKRKKKSVVNPEYVDTTYYVPTVEYVIDSEKYTIKADGQSIKYEVGQEVVVKYNPQNPSESYMIGDEPTDKSKNITFVFGVILILVSTALVAYVRKLIKRA
ncbi:MAG: DUF3592 domain-containing protein [Coprococcus sp.]